MCSRAPGLVVALLVLAGCGGGASGSAATDAGGDVAVHGEGGGSGGSSGSGSSGSGSGSGGGDAAGDGPVHTATHDCTPACGSGRLCEYPQGPGICPGPDQDAGFCPQGCQGCPALPPPACSALPAACASAPSCDCLLNALCTGCGSPGGSCAIDADGDWVVACLSC